MQTHKDLSAPKREALERVDVRRLPLSDSFRHVSGSGRRTVYVFSDPDCPYCRTLQSELEKLDDLTIVVFEYPLTALHPDAERKSISIWCAGDDADRWNLWHRTLVEKLGYSAGKLPKSYIQKPRSGSEPEHSGNAHSDFIGRASHAWIGRRHKHQRMVGGKTEVVEGIRIQAPLISCDMMQGYRCRPIDAAALEMWIAGREQVPPSKVVPMIAA